MNYYSLLIHLTKLYPSRKEQKQEYQAQAAIHDKH